jgi:cell fate regulator YaaT (PSP1 superfamily)
MAKAQKLSLNPTRISGMCGRLMCCLAHEANENDNARKASRAQ